MASATTAPLPIYYNTDVHNFYIKQKQEFHFTQKSDNEFLMFLLDTAVRVISIVQHLAPVIEAVSDAGVEVDDIEDEVSPIHTPNTTSNISSGAMDVDTVDQTAPSALSAELEQINQEITNAQISSQQLPRQPSIPTRRPAPLAAPAPAHVPVTVPVAASTSSESEPAMLPASQPTAMLTVSQPTAMLNVSQPAAQLTAAQPTAQTPSTSATRIDSTPLPPNVPSIQLPSSAHSSENTSTSLPSATQPIAEPPDDPLPVKTEQPVPEVIEIKEEVPESASSELLSQDTLDQLMSSISGAEDNAGLQNFVPTATPSSLPPSFLDRGAGNPLSMLGSLNSGDGPGPSGLNVPNISESMMKNINDAGLNVSSIKGQANPRQDSCDYCTTGRIKVEPVEADTPSLQHAKPPEVASSEKSLNIASSSGASDKDNTSQPAHQFRKLSQISDVSHFSCSFCEVSFRSHEALRKHLMDDQAHAAKTSASHDQLSVFSCQVCHISFLSEACLREHNEAIHRVKIKRVFHCHMCPASVYQKVKFSTLQGLRKHVTSHHNNNDSASMCKCGICSLHCYSVKSLEVHLRRTKHHDNYEGVGPFSCNVCSQRKCASFSTAYLLKLHFKQAHSLHWHTVLPPQIPPRPSLPVHSGAAQELALKITCIFCKAEFESRELLKEHERTHLLGLKDANLGRGG